MSTRFDPYNPGRQDRGRKKDPDDFGGPSGPGTGTPGPGEWEWLDILERARRQQKFNTVMEGGWAKEPNYIGNQSLYGQDALGMLNTMARFKAGGDPEALARKQALGDITQEDMAYMSAKDLAALSAPTAAFAKSTKPGPNVGIPQSLSREEIAKFTDPAYVQQRLRSIGSRYSMMTGRGIFQDTAGSKYDPFQYIPQGFFS